MLAAGQRDFQGWVAAAGSPHMGSVGHILSFEAVAFAVAGTQSAEDKIAAGVVAVGSPFVDIASYFAEPLAAGCPQSIQRNQSDPREGVSAAEELAWVDWTMEREQTWARQRLLPMVLKVLRNLS